MKKEKKNIRFAIDRVKRLNELIIRAFRVEKWVQNTWNITQQHDEGLFCSFEFECTHECIRVASVKRVRFDVKRIEWKRAKGEIH